MNGYENRGASGLGSNNYADVHQQIAYSSQNQNVPQPPMAYVEEQGRVQQQFFAAQQQPFSAQQQASATQQEAPAAQQQAYAPKQQAPAAQQPFAPYAPQQAFATQQAGYASMPNQQNGQAPFSPFTTYTQNSEANSDTNMENLLGRKVIGVVASVLVILGIVVLGSEVIPELSDTVKVALMFAVSGVLTVVGSALAFQRLDGFTAALMGCGAGTLFISLFATYEYFELINEPVVYLLVLAWLAMCLALVRKTGSQFMGVVLQAGYAISIASTYMAKATELHLAIMLVYLLASSVILVGGSLRFYPKVHRASLITSLVMYGISALYFTVFEFPWWKESLGSVEAIAFGAAAVITICVCAGVVLRLMKVSSKAIVAYAACCTFFVLAYLRFCTPFAMEPYQWTLCCMAIALVCVGTGFAARIGGLRLYGLILVIACVVKLVVIDIAWLEGLAQVIAFIVGGIICFAISALYNYAVKRLAE